MTHTGFRQILFACTFGLALNSQAGDFRNLAKIEKLRTIQNGRYAELMENIEALNRTMALLGVEDNQGTYDPNGLNRAIGLFDAMVDKNKGRSVELIHLPSFIQDVRSISSGFHRSTAVYHCSKNGYCPKNHSPRSLTHQERAAAGAWSEYDEMIRSENAK